MDNKLITILVISILVVGGAAGAAYYMLNDSGEDTNPYAGETIKDGAGREVKIPEKVNTIATFGGTDPLRFVSYLNLHEKVIEVDHGDIVDNKNGRAYSYAYPYDQLPDLHGDQGMSSADLERLGENPPDVVVVAYYTYNGDTKGNFDLLAKKTNVYVLYRLNMFGAYWGDDYKLNKEFVDQITNLGKFLGASERAEELIGEWNDILSDIRSLMTGTRKDLKTYVSGLTYRGSNELTTTFPYYAPLELIGASNVVTGDPGSKYLTVEEFGELEFNTMVVDPSSSDKLNTHKSQMVLKSIYLKNNDDDASNDIKIYSVMPIVWDGCNWDCSLVGTYMMLHLYYGSLSLEEVKGRINAGFVKFYKENGKDVLKDMSKFFDIKSSGSGSNMPLLGELTVKYNKTVDMYYFSAAA